MTLYLAANGQPFTDPDAAAYKADRMKAESGERFQVVPTDGGYAVQPKDAPNGIDQAREDLATDSPTHQFPPGEAAPPEPEPIPEPTAVEQPFVVTLRPAWRAQITGFALMLLGALLVIAPTWPVAIFSIEAVYELNARLPGIWDDIALLGFALCFIGIVVVLFRRYWQKSVITNDGVMQSVGILILSNVSHIDMANVHVVDVKKPNLVHILLNLGTVELSTPGSSGADVAIVDVVAPQKLATFIRERVAINKRRGSTGTF